MSRFTFVGNASRRPFRDYRPEGGRDEAFVIVDHKLERVSRIFIDGFIELETKLTYVDWKRDRDTIRLDELIDWLGIPDEEKELYREYLCRV